MKWNIFKKKDKVRNVTIYKLSTMSLTPANIFYMKDNKAFWKFVNESGVNIIWEYDGYRYVLMDNGIIGVQIEE